MCPAPPSEAGPVLPSAASGAYLQAEAGARNVRTTQFGKGGHAVVEIIPYQTRWPEEFADVAARIHDALGELALRVDHIGSTSVPGLASKDVIDVQVTLRSEEDYPAVEHAMKEAGFSHREGVFCDHRPPDTDGPDSDWEKRYFREPEGEKRTHIHVRVQDRPNQRYPLLFRDYLRTHPAAAAGYAELKRRLADLAGENRPAYVDTKNPVCDIIIAAAEDWARESE